MFEKDNVHQYDVKTSNEIREMTHVEQREDGNICVACGEGSRPD